MELQGIHHITAITGDAPRNVDFYARGLGLRLVKKTVNFDAPDVYHLYYGDETGAPGTILTFFEFPGAAPGRAGEGMVHRLSWAVGDLDAWEQRLRDERVATRREDGALRFADPEGLELELVGGGQDGPTKFAGVRAYASDPQRSAALLEGLGVDRELWSYDPAPAQRGRAGAGTVHHIAWASRDEDHEAWRERARDLGAHVTPIIDRQYFRSIYFREPSGVLFEIATLGPGFAIDEDPEHLGEALRLPPQHEHLRERLERTLTPLPVPTRT
jgi:glyoxalase family protein